MGIFIIFWITGVCAGVLPQSQEFSPLKIWPQEVESLDSGSLKARLAVLDKASACLPKSCQPAFRFQKVFLQAVSDVPPSLWRKELENLSRLPGVDPLERGVSETARVWMARLQMKDLDRVLKNYYQEHVRFPETWNEVENSIPSNLRTDPWEKPWIYSPQAPKGFERLPGQRYELGPTLFPRLSTFKEATEERAQVSRSWKAVLRTTGNTKALGFLALSGPSTITVIQPGGRFEGCHLLYIGDSWALMAGQDQLFAIPYGK